MNSRKNTVTVEKASVETREGEWFVKYHTKEGQGQIDVRKIQDVSSVKQRNVWILVGGLALILLTPFIIPELFRDVGGYLVAALQSLLTISGFGLLVCYAFPLSYVIVKHEGGELRIKLRKKGQREAFVDEIKQKKELGRPSQD